MSTVFYVAGAVALISTLLVITRSNAVHALLYLVVSLLAVAVIFYDIGAPFVAALEVIIYAGAIMVIFVFVLMMLSLGPRAVAQEHSWLRPGIWIGPAVLAAILAAQVIYSLVATAGPSEMATALVAPKQVGESLFGPYFIGVELASLLLLAGLVGALHLARAPAKEDA
jgi:NADH-quinone oxidoreductase subunit J